MKFKRYSKIIIGLLSLFLIFSFASPSFSLDVFEPEIEWAQTYGDEYLGFAGYVNSLSDLQNTISIMQNLGCNTYRVTSRPSWQIADGEVRGYNIEWIDYLLANTDFIIIVDGNHLYPANEDSASEARTHWSEVEGRIFQVLSRYGNNSRVAVELINEYISDDFYNRMQTLVTQIRDAGYTNPIVVNKTAQIWEVIADPLDSTYQGMHFYFNTWSVEDAIWQMDFALNHHGLKIINTEIGASSNEYKDYTQENVDKVSAFLLESYDLSVGNCLWMNNDSLNWPTYEEYDLQLGHPSPTPDPLSVEVRPTGFDITSPETVEIEYEIHGGVPPYTIDVPEDTSHIGDWTFEDFDLIIEISRAERHDRGWTLVTGIMDANRDYVEQKIHFTFSEPEPTPTSTPSPTPTPEVTSTLSPTPTTSPTASPTPNPSPTSTPTPTVSPNPTDSPNPTPTPMPNPSLASTLEPTSVPIPTPELLLQAGFRLPSEYAAIGIATIAAIVIVILFLRKK